MNNEIIIGVATQNAKKENVNFEGRIKLNDK